MINLSVKISRTIITMTIVIFCASIGQSFAGSAFNITSQDIAIEGADPVAYFTQSKYVRGSSQYTYIWHGATWRFSSEAHREAFRAEPEKFAPQYGGWCAHAAARGYLADIDPKAWTVHKEKLYLNFNKGIRARWKKDIPGEISRADKNWPNIKPSQAK